MLHDCLHRDRAFNTLALRTQVSQVDLDCGLPLHDERLFGSSACITPKARSICIRRICEHARLVCRGYRSPCFYILCVSQYGRSEGTGLTPPPSLQLYSASSNPLPLPLPGSGTTTASGCIPGGCVVVHHARSVCFSTPAHSPGWPMCWARARCSPPLQPPSPTYGRCRNSTPMCCPPPPAPPPSPCNVTYALLHLLYILYVVYFHALVADTM